MTLSDYSQGNADIEEELRRHIKWAYKLFDIVFEDVEELCALGWSTSNDIIKWKQWAKEHKLIGE